ncbi:phosphatase PAP2 family protein [Microlunatus panaciterrae]|uniref:Undecaprenyl-diphosphatase n=1 Tax=Microlunatus panaciterrae TaxID=400768 RepID=A0ABS2RI08_9ACTN|nr:phosphatase PAP2 family protein [Microlunatus panaciterrae]MBM7798628.1 undecaprenyl-diphosphatase [Microlunatus panaciterrae]
MQLRDEDPQQQTIGERDLTRWHTRLGHWLVALASSLAQVVSAHVVLVVTAAAGAVLLLGLVAAGSAVYDAVDEGDGIAGLDRPALKEAMSLRTPANEQLVTWFTNLGGPIGMTIIATVITLIMVLAWRSKTPAILMIIAVAGSLPMTTVGKAVVGRVRPPTIDAVPPFETSPSFPSGHTLNSTVIAGLVAYLVLSHLASLLARILTVALAAGWAVAMGLSRVFLGHHWLTDVIFAWLLGAAWLTLIITAHRLYLTVRRRT